MESREESSLPFRSPFFSFNMKPPQNPNHFSRFPRHSSPRVNNYKSNSLYMYNTRGIDLNHSNQSFHLTSRLLGGGPTALGCFSSNPFELGFSSFYANVFPYGSNEGVSKDVMHGGWGQYDDETRPNKNNNYYYYYYQKARENEAGASGVKVPKGDEYVINMAHMQHDDLGNKKEIGKEQEDGGGGQLSKRNGVKRMIGRFNYYVFVVCFNLFM